MIVETGSGPAFGRTQTQAGEREDGPGEPGLFKSFFLAGFECSTHRRGDGRRLDLLAATRHDRFAVQDYRTIADHGLRTVRDGLRWHLIEVGPGRYDWSSFLPMLRAARQAGLQVIWDLCHYGYPDDIDAWKPAFVERFARFAQAAARLVLEETGEPGFFCPINEISYWSWAGGANEQFNPFGRNRGDEFKRQLVRASIAAIEAVWSVDRRSRIFHSDPIINVMPARGRDRVAAQGYHNAQFQAWDMIAGRIAPELGGRPDYLDVVGANYYCDNQWLHGGPTIGLGHHQYRPLRDLLADVHKRYGRPLFIAETGAEGTARASWFHYVAGEVRAAIAAGVPIEGVCLYPILDYPGWENGRTCHVGLFGRPDAQGHREIEPSLAEELEREQQRRLLGMTTMRRSQPHLLHRTG